MNCDTPIVANIRRLQTYIYLYKRMHNNLCCGQKSNIYFNYTCMHVVYTNVCNVKNAPLLAWVSRSS